MLVFGDLNPNQSGDSVKMALKRTIVQHELIFKDQVHELHRLYWTQKNLMRELCRKELEAKVLSQSRRVGLVMEGNVGSLQVVKGKFIDTSDNRHRGSTQNSAKSSIGKMIRPGYSGANEAIDETGGVMIDKGENLYCYEVIDLEGPVDVDFKVPRADCGVMGSSRLDNVSDMDSSSRIRNDPGFVLDLNNSYADCSEKWKDHEVEDHRGTGGSESGIAGVHVSTDSSHKQERNSSKSVLIDLNIPQDDCHAVDDPMITFSSPSSSSSVVQNEVLWRDQSKDRNIRETSAALNSETPYSASTCKCTDYLLPSSEDSQRSHVSEFHGKQDNILEGSNLKGLTECCRNTVEGLPNIAAVDNNDREENLANNAINGEDGLNAKCLMERKSGLSGCTSSEKIMEENSETTQLDDNKLVEGGACEDDVEDHAVIDAANILAGISLRKPSSQVEQLFNNRRDQPEDSSDSFETMTLKLPEVRNHEQHFIMPAGQNGKDAEEDIAASRVNYKLRRGRGRAVRDFQKDVLPGMVSLSRHEICKDMHSIGYELRKNGSRRGSCFVPVQSGRSRRYTVRRRQ